MRCFNRLFCATHRAARHFYLFFRLVFLYILFCRVVLDLAVGFLLQIFSKLLDVLLAGKVTSLTWFKFMIIEFALVKIITNVALTLKKP